MEDITVPPSAAAITPDWLQAALPDSVLGGARVVAVGVERLGLGEGFAGELARLTVETDPPGVLPPMVAKFASGHGTTRDLLVEMGGYEKEVRFYRDLAAGVDMPTPACYVARIDAEAGTFMLLLEDLAPGKVGDQVVGATLEQAQLAIDALARLHAQWWNKPWLLEQPWLLPPQGFAKRLIELFDEGMPALREAWGPQYPDVVDVVVEARGLLPTVLERFGEGAPQRPFTLVHGDYRLDNMFFPTPDGGRFAIIDWQGAAAGSPTNDLAYWMMLNLTVETRRAHEDALLRRYHAGLRRHGVSGFSLGALRRNYRNSAVILLGFAPVLVGNLDFGEGRGRALIESAAERVDAAMRDHNARRTLRTLRWVLRGMTAWDRVRALTAAGRRQALQQARRLRDGGRSSAG